VVPGIGMGMECIPEWSIIFMWFCLDSTLRHVAASRKASMTVGRTAHVISPARDEDGTRLDFSTRLAAYVDRKIAISATTHATAAIQKIASASG
jgi:hypothetical protein